MSKLAKDYINNVLRQKRPEFSGRAVCPFAGPELDSDNLMIDEVGDKNLIELIQQFNKSN